MGMDVYGTEATAEVGRCFRNGVWGWRPLAGFLTAVYPDLTAGCAYWQSNDGDGLDGTGALALADALDRDLASGRVTAYADQYAAWLAALPDSECFLCQGTGVRTDEIGRLYGMDRPRDPATGNGGCNGCQGSGRTENRAKSYPFEVENVRRFAGRVQPVDATPPVASNCICSSKTSSGSSGGALSRVPRLRCPLPLRNV